MTPTRPPGGCTHESRGRRSPSADPTASLILVLSSERAASRLSDTSVFSCPSPFWESFAGLVDGVLRSLVVVGLLLRDRVAQVLEALTNLLHRLLVLGLVLLEGLVCARALAELTSSSRPLPPSRNPTKPATAIPAMTRATIGQRRLPCCCSFGCGRGLVNHTLSSSRRRSPRPRMPRPPRPPWHGRPVAPSASPIAAPPRPSGPRSTW